MSAVRIMTWNIRSCLGIDGVRSIERVAGVIAREKPTVVALQEVDFGRRRSGRIDQAAAIADLLGMHWIGAPSLTAQGDGAYGNAIVGTVSLELLQHQPLPRVAWAEPRTAMWVRFRCGETPIDCINTHLSFLRADRPAQIDRLMDEHWLGSDALGPRVVLCGDFNCGVRDRGFRALASQMRDAQLTAASKASATWPTRRPVRRLDHILVSPALSYVSARVVRSPEARVASDHYPVVAEISV